MRTKIGNLAADCGPDPSREGKRRYIQIGAAFHDESRENSLSFKIDCLPLEGSGWTGWVNVFPHKDSGSERPSGPGPGQFD